LEKNKSSRLLALPKVKKTRGGADSISLKFIVIMGIRQRQTTFPVETRTAKIPNHYNTKIMCIQLVLQKAKVISSLLLGGK
jgi:3-phenylpropionate/cinnamic acid dioxygenase small subunit